MLLKLLGALQQEQMEAKEREMAANGIGGHEETPIEQMFGGKLQYESESIFSNDGSKFHNPLPFIAICQQCQHSTTLFEDTISGLGLGLGLQVNSSTRRANLDLERVISAFFEDERIENFHCLRYKCYTNHIRSLELDKI